MRSFPRFLAAMLVVVQLPLAFAAPIPSNVLTITDDTALAFKTADTAVDTTIVLGQGSLMYQFSVGIADATLVFASGSHATLTAPAGIGMQFTPAAGANLQISYPCGSQTAVITSSAAQNFVITALANGAGSCTPAVAAPFFGGGGGGGGGGAVSSDAGSFSTSGGGSSTTPTRPSAPFVAIPPDCFTDTAKHIYGSQICDLKSRGIITGYADDTFRPAGLINRAEFTHLFMLALRAYRGEALTAPKFSGCFEDIPKGAWYEADVCDAKARGLITGYSPTTFGGDRPINFAEGLAIFLRSRGDDVPKSAKDMPWFSAYIEYIRKKETDKLLVKTSPYHQLMRAEVVHMLVLLFPIAY